MRQIASESYDRMKKTHPGIAGSAGYGEIDDGGRREIIRHADRQRLLPEPPAKDGNFLPSYLGAVGSFFSGSATISNLTFSGIQNSIAQNLGLDRTIILSAQSVGGAMGNMVSINNIVAVCSILGIINKEGAILKKTFLPTLLYGVNRGNRRLFSLEWWIHAVLRIMYSLISRIGFSKPGSSHAVPPATIGALRAPVFYRLWR